VRLLAKLRHGVVEICAGDECRYAEPTLLQRAYLLWTFRNFRRLSVRVLNPRQRQIIERLSDFAHRADGKGMNSALVIGRAELGAFPLHRPPLVAQPKQTADLQLTDSGIRSTRGMNLLVQFPRVIFASAAETLATSSIRRTQSHARYSLILSLAAASLVIISVAVAQRLWINHGKTLPAEAPNSDSQQPTVLKTVRPEVATQKPAVAVPSAASQDAKPVPAKTATPRALAVAAQMFFPASTSKDEVATRSPKPVQTKEAFSAANADPESTRLRVFLAPRTVIYPAIPTSGAIVDEKKHILVKAIVNPEGTVDEVQVPGQVPSLARAIDKTVKQWRYQPYVLNGQPVAVETHMIFTVLGPDAITVRFLPAGESPANE